MRNDRKENRAFKGIWIPKEIWLNDELSVMEKLFLVEIDSLDNEDGCFASNAYFAGFFDISKGRCSQIIKSLERKKLIKIELIYEGKQISKRVIRVINKLNRVDNKLNEVDNKLNSTIKNIKYPYLENDEDSNTSFSNTVVNNPINIKPSKADALDSEFDEWWEIYGKKGNRKPTLQKFKTCRKKHSFEQIINGTKEYLKTVTDKKFQKHGSTFLNAEAYMDDYTQDANYNIGASNEVSSMEKDLGLEREKDRKLTQEEKEKANEELPF